MSQILELNDLKKGTNVTGLVILDNYEIKTYGNQGKRKASGSVSAGGSTKPFVAWEGAAFGVLDSNELAGQIVEIDVEVGEYRDEIQLTLKGLRLDHGVVDHGLFYKSVDRVALKDNLLGLMKDNMSVEAVTIFHTLLKQEGISADYLSSFAAAKMHDAQIGGLANHTYKMMRYANLLLELEPRLQEYPDYEDLLYLGIALHDVGKTKELKLAAYTEFSYVTHRIIGAEMLSRVKQLIVETKGESFYWQLIAIIVGHHGEFEDKARTVVTQIVHMIDMLDANVTGILDRIERGDVSNSTAGKGIWHNGNMLYL